MQEHQQKKPTTPLRSPNAKSVPQTRRCIRTFVIRSRAANSCYHLLSLNRLVLEITSQQHALLKGGTPLTPTLACKINKFYLRIY